MPFSEACTRTQWKSFSVLLKTWSGRFQAETALHLKLSI